MSNPYPGFGQQPQQPPQGYGGYPQMPGQGPGQGQFPVPTGQAAPLPPPGSESRGRRGTSKALPIMVAAGLAVGVCGGLILVLGTGESKAATDKPKETGKQGGEVPDDGKEVAVMTPDAAAPPPPPDAAPEPKTRKVTVTFEVEPSDATVSVDDEELAGSTYSLELERDQSKKVAIEVKASGYKTFKEERTIKGDDTIEITLDKRSTRSSGTRRNTGGTRRNTGGQQGSGSGRIDF